MVMAVKKPIKKPPRIEKMSELLACPREKAQSSLGGLLGCWGGTWPYGLGSLASLRSGLAFLSACPISLRVKDS